MDYTHWNFVTKYLQNNVFEETFLGSTLYERLYRSQLEHYTITTLILIICNVLMSGIVGLDRLAWTCDNTENKQIKVDISNINIKFVENISNFDVGLLVILGLLIIY